MRVERTISYSANLTSVQQAYISAELAQARAKTGNLAQPKHVISHEDTTPLAVTSLVVPADKLPEKARRLIKRDINATITQQWDGTGPDSATAQFTVDAGSLPVSVTLTQTLRQDGDTTLCTFAGDVKVNVPFVGAKLEQIAASKVDELLDGDRKLVEQIMASK